MTKMYFCFFAFLLTYTDHSFALQGFSGKQRDPIYLIQDMCSTLLRE